ncbi:MAG: SGNH/GDSL hydrolase family protein [Candidatus Krumholzibacteriota bacterium]
MFDIRGYHQPRTRDWDHALLPEAERLPGVKTQFKPHSRFELRYDSNPRGYFDRNNGLAYHINNHGFRGPDYEKRKAPGTTRIIVLGDSFTFGEGVRLEHTFCSRLEEILNQRSGGVAEVLNFGTSTWGTDDEINYLEQAGLEFEPDLVVLVYVFNDADYAGGLDLWENFRSEYENRYLKHSYLASYMYATLKRRLYGQQYIDELLDSAMQEQHKWTASMDYLLKGRHLAEAGGAKYAVVVFPFMYELDEQHPFRPLQLMLSDYCARNGIVELDLLEAFMGEAYTDLWVHPSDQHPNERGHRIAAEAIAGFILENDLLPPRTEARDLGVD